MMMNSGGATSGHARSNDLAGRSTALAPPCLLLCFASVIVWNENKNFYHIWPLYLFWQWNNLSGVGGLRVLRATSSELQLDVRHLNRWRRHLVNAYEVKASMVFIAGKTVWSMPERFKVVYHARRYTSALLYLPTLECEMCLVQLCDTCFTLTPCGHQRFCELCANEVHNQGRGWPICRTPINMLLRLY